MPAMMQSAFNAGLGFTLFENTGIRQLKSGFNYDKTMKFKGIPKSFIRLTCGRAEYFAQTRASEEKYQTHWIDQVGL
jgi:hypothetical protein